MWWLCNWTHLLKTIGLYAYNGWILWCMNCISIKLKVSLKTELLIVSYSIWGIVHFLILCDLGEMVNVYSLFSQNPYSLGYIGAIGLKQEWFHGMNEWLCGMNANPVVGEPTMLSTVPPAGQTSVSSPVKWRREVDMGNTGLGDRGME